MIEKSLIKKMASYILRSRNKAFFDRSIMHPKRDWLTGIIVALVVAGVGIFWSARAYNQYSHIEITTTNLEEEEVIYRESLIETALADFAARKNAYEELKTQLLNKYQKQEAAVPVIETEISTSTPTEEIPVLIDEESSTDIPTGTTEGIIFE